MLLAGAVLAWAAGGVFSAGGGGLWLQPPMASMQLRIRLVETRWTGDRVECMRVFSLDFMIVVIVRTLFMSV